MVKLGQGFADTIIKETSRRGHQESDFGESPKRPWQLFLFPAIMVIGFLLLFGRLTLLQVVQGSRNRDLAEGNRIKVEVIPAPRGIIFDRAGRPLVRNVPVFRRETAAGVFEEISREEALSLEALAQGHQVSEEIVREYVAGPALAHVLGYLGQASPEEVAAGYRLGSLVGRSGVEAANDRLLRGVDGGRLIEVDTFGREVREIGKKEPIPGQNLETSLDLEFSQVAYRALAGRPGAVVAQEAQTGQIIALVSSPSFDPNLFTFGITQEELAALMADPENPFLNRAIAGAYPPGSTFKIVTAAAGLEEGRIDENFTYDDPGVITIGQFSYANWYFTQYGRREGVVDLVRAIKRSTDTFFYQVGELVGAERLAFWGHQFGLGEIAGIDIGGETAGLVPTPAWKEKVYGERWFLGNTYHLSIGQGDIALTPLQVNGMAAVIASGGKVCRPQVAQGLALCRPLALAPKTVPLISQGMTEACSPGGTAFPFFAFSPPVACKTGTAEFGDPQNRTHAWLTAFAPASPDASRGGPADPSADGPEIVVTALVEGGGEGSAVAAPIVREVLDYWFHKR